MWGFEPLPSQAAAHHFDQGRSGDNENGVYSEKMVFSVLSVGIIEKMGFQFSKIFWRVPNILGTNGPWLLIVDGMSLRQNPIFIGSAGSFLAKPVGRVLTRIFSFNFDKILRNKECFIQVGDRV